MPTVYTKGVKKLRNGQVLAKQFNQFGEALQNFSVS